MKRIPTLSLAPAAAALVWLALSPKEAAAATPADVQMASGIDAIDIVVEIDGQAVTASVHPFYKPAGSLQMHLPLSIFGLPANNVAVANGTINGSNITWSFDEHMSVDLGGWDDIKRISGNFTLHIDPFSWWDRFVCELDGHCNRNAKLSLVSSQILMEGDTTFNASWSEPVYLQVFDAEAGPGFPHIGSAYGPTKTEGVGFGAPEGSFESTDITILLTQPAPIGGTVVEIDSSIPPGHGFSHNTSVTIPAGKTVGLARFNAYRGVRGTVQLSFSTSLSHFTRSLTIVDPPKKQGRRPWDVLWVWERVPWCIRCGPLLGWSDALGPLIQLEDHFMFTVGEEPMALETELGTIVDITSVGANGWVSGLLERGRSFVGQVGSEGLSAVELTSSLEGEFGYFEVKQIDGAGTAYGAWHIEGGPPIAALWPNGATEPVLLAELGEGSTIQAVNDYGYFVGSSARGYAFIGQTDGAIRLLQPPEGAQSMELLSVNRSGVAVGHAWVDDMKLPIRAFLDGEAQVLSDDVDAQGSAVAIDGTGLIFINHDIGEEPTVSVFVDEEGLVSLDQYMHHEEAEIQATRVRHVLGDDSVVFDAWGPEGELTTYVGK